MHWTSVRFYEIGVSIILIIIIRVIPELYKLIKSSKKLQKVAESIKLFGKTKLSRDTQFSQKLNRFYIMLFYYVILKFLVNAG